jgi:hypothetical protein
MIKKIFIEGLKIILILLMGQIPVKNSTLGGEFVRQGKKVIRDLPSKLEKWVVQAGLKQEEET